MPDDSSSSSSIIVVDPPWGSSSSDGGGGGGGGSSGNGSSGNGGSGGGGTGGSTGHHPPMPNQAILNELLKAEQICLKAQKPDYSTPLAARDISGQLVSDTLVAIQSARAQSAAATQATTGKHGVTGTEETLKKQLVARVSEIQTAAKQKFGRTQPNRLDDYYIGQRIDQNRARLEQLAEQIIAKAGADALPGINSTKLTAATGALTAYRNVEESQSGAQSGATGGRTSLKTMVKAITDTRIAIQLAADAEWPHESPANAAVRREFKLPANSKFKG